MHATTGPPALRLLPLLNILSIIFSKICRASVPEAYEAPYSLQN